MMVRNQVFSTDELNQFKASAKNLQIRDSIILDLLIDHGLRPVEIVSINKVDVDLNKETINMNEKGWNRKIFISRELADKITMMMSDKGYVNWKNDALFMGDSHKRMRRSAVDEMCKKLSNYTGIQDVSPHRFRITFYTQISEFGGDLMQVIHIRRKKA